MSKRRITLSVSSRLLMVLIGIATIPTCIVGSADAEVTEATRAEYVEHAEPICKKNTIANRHVLKGTRNAIRHGRLGIAAHKFATAAKEFGSTVKQLEELSRPAADESILTRWFKHLNGETVKLQTFAERLRKHNTVDLDAYVLELRHYANITNNIVLTFGFDYCLIQTARYL